MGRTANGRMINQDISLSSRVAPLSPEALALFCLLIAHFNAHGKMVANPYSIKGTVCPLISWLTVERIEVCLAEISANTNVKWWRDDRGLYYLHSLSWKEHQTLREDRLGPDHLPDYPGDCSNAPVVLLDHSGITTQPLPDHSLTTPAKEKVREDKSEGKNIRPDALRLSEILADRIASNNLSNRSIQTGQRETSIKRWALDIEKMLRIDTRDQAEIEAVIEWAQNDDFWRSNILSGAKLREKYDTLRLQMQSKVTKTETPVFDPARPWIKIDPYGQPYNAEMYRDHKHQLERTGEIQQ